MSNQIIDPPDRAKLPIPLQSLDWQLRTDDDLFYDGDQVLVAVPVRDRYGGGWYYELSVITVHCDEGYFDADLHGESWGWSWSDVEWFVRLSPAPEPDDDSSTPTAQPDLDRTTVKD